ncbi:MAG TPA: protein translocase subunit SecD [Candidatus Saccharimonadia bacterium]|nr:protein translocase subunit SecD [Candidatus Saccharimonadia bacterium]
MLEYARWKYVVIALVVLLATIYSLPNLYPQDPAVQVSGNRGAIVDDALRASGQAALDEAKIAYKSIELADERLLVRLASGDQQLAAAEKLDDALGDEYTTALNLAPTVPAWLDAIRAKPMALGLDLQGGVHFLMEIDREAALDKQQERFVDDLRTYLRDKNLRYRQVTRTPDGLLIVMRSEADRDSAFTGMSRDFLALELEDRPVSEDNFPLLARLKPSEAGAELDKAIEQNIKTLRSRLNELKVAEPIVQRQGESRIAVQLPGVQDTTIAKKILGATATLEYRAVDETANPLEAQQTGRVPPDSRLYFMRPMTPGGAGQPIVLKKRLIVSGDELTDAAAGFDENGLPAVHVTLNAVGGRKMQAFTDDNVGKRMAVVFIERIPEIRIVDGKEVRTNRIKEEVINAATIQGRFGKRFQTTGLQREEASEISLLLRAGALAAPMDIVEERVIGPSLGKENIQKGWTAVVFSFVFVLIFFVVYYKVFGLIANVALLLNLLLLVAVMSVLGANLTLPGLAGIVLTVGMSVDANVLINERIREELRAGNTPLSSIVAGYEKAAGTIADANVTALLAGIALLVFGSGPVQGFAVALCVGILTSLYTAVSVSRGIATLIYGRRRKLKALSI